MTFSIREPAPHHPPQMGYGRGGAGNRTRPLQPTSIKASSLTSTQTHDLHTSYTQNHGMPNFSTGRGGAGNMHHADEERRMFSFDEELAKQGKVGASPIYHVGRGGQGNAVNERRQSDASSSTSSGSDKRSSLEWVKGLARTSRSS